LHRAPASPHRNRTQMEIPNHTVGKVIGLGGMATVYRAEHVLLKQERALKLMSPKLCRKPGFQESFVREGQIVAGLHHPHIVTIHDIGYCDEGYFMSMEYLNGGSLNDRLGRGKLSLHDAITVLRQVGEALHHAHGKRLIHRDIKPANILFRANGEAVLTDFGISKLQDTQSDLTRHGYTMVGTLRYMSPEQTGTQQVDRRSDIYSLALVFYEMLTGMRAIQADATALIIREHALAPPPALPIEYAFLQAVLNRALAKDPDQRYASVSDFVRAVERSQVSENTATIHAPSQRLKSLPTKMWYSFVFMLLPLIVVAGISWWMWTERGYKAKDEPPSTPWAMPTVEETVPNETSVPLPEQAMSNEVAPVRPFTEAEAWGVKRKIKVAPYAIFFRQPGENERLGTISQGTEVTVLGTVVSADGREWKKAKFESREGFLKADQLME
jgi:serine/threonine protein kinase